MDLRSGGKGSGSRDGQGGNSSDDGEGPGVPDPIGDKGDSLVDNETDEVFTDAQGTSFHQEQIIDLQAQIESINESFRLVNMGNADTGGVRSEHGETSNQEPRPQGELSDNDSHAIVQPDGEHNLRSPSRHAPSSMEGHGQQLGDASPIDQTEIRDALPTFTGIGDSENVDGSQSFQDNPTVVAVLAASQRSQPNFRSRPSGAPVGGAEPLGINNDFGNLHESTEVTIRGTMGGPRGDGRRNLPTRSDHQDSTTSGDRPSSGPVPGSGVAGAARAMEYHHGRTSDSGAPDLRPHSGASHRDHGQAPQSDRHNAGLRSGANDHGDNQEDCMPKYLEQPPRKLGVDHGIENREQQRLKENAEKRLRGRARRSSNSTPYGPTQHFSSSPADTGETYYHDYSRNDHGGVATSFVSRTGKTKPPIHTSIRNDGSHGLRQGRYPPGPDPHGMDFQEPEPFRLRSGRGGDDGPDPNPTPIFGGGEKGPARIIHTGTMARQILTLNRLYHGSIMNQRMESKLARKEGESLQDLYQSVGMGDSDDESFASYGAGGAQQEYPFSGNVDSNKVRTTLAQVQTDLKQTRKMGTTLKRDMSRFLIKEFNMSGEENKYDKSLALTKFAWPSGIDGHANQEAAHRLKAELHKLFSAHSRALAPVLPMYDEMSGATRGLSPGKPRFVPPDTRFGGTIVGSQRVPYFDTEYAKANEALFEVLEGAPGGYALVRRYFGGRSYGTTSTNRTMCHGRDKDGLSILLSILLYHESTTFSARQNLKTKLDHSHGLFARGSVPKAISEARKLIELGHLHKVKLDYNVIATIAGALSSRNAMFAIKLEKWMEARSGICEHDALGVFDEFLCEVDQINQKITVAIPGAATQQSIRAMRVLRMDMTDHVGCDETEMDSEDHMTCYSTNQPSGFRGRQGSGRGKSSGKFSGQNRGSKPRGSSKQGTYTTCRALNCDGRLPVSSTSLDTFVCQKCFHKLVDTGTVKLKNGTTRTLERRGSSSGGRSTSTFKKRNVRTEAYANAVHIHTGKLPREHVKGGAKSRTNRGANSTSRSRTKSTKMGEENNPSNLFVGGCRPDEFRFVSNPNRKPPNERIMCARVKFVAKDSKDFRNGNADSCCRPRQRNKSAMRKHARKSNRERSDDFSKSRSHCVTTMRAKKGKPKFAFNDATMTEPCRCRARGHHGDHGHPKSRNSTTKSYSSSACQRDERKVGGPSGIYADDNLNSRRHARTKAQRTCPPRPQVHCARATVSQVHDGIGASNGERHLNPCFQISTPSGTLHSWCDDNEVQGRTDFVPVDHDRALTYCPIHPYTQRLVGTSTHGTSHAKCLPSPTNLESDKNTSDCDQKHGANLCDQCKGDHNVPSMVSPMSRDISDPKRPSDHLKTCDYDIEKSSMPLASSSSRNREDRHHCDDDIEVSMPLGSSSSCHHEDRHHYDYDNTSQRGSVQGGHSSGDFNTPWVPPEGINDSEMFRNSAEHSFKDGYLKEELAFQREIVTYLTAKAAFYKAKSSLGRNTRNALAKHRMIHSLNMNDTFSALKLKGAAKTHCTNMHNVHECIRHAHPPLRSPVRGARQHDRISCSRVHITHSKNDLPSDDTLVGDGHSRAPKEYMHFRAIVDTGCSSSLFKSNTGSFLSEPTESPARIVGFEGGKEISGGIRGVAHCYAISDNPSHRGAYFKQMVDTVGGLNDNLFSIHNLTRFKGYKMVFSTQPGVISGLHSESSKHEGKKHIIPVTFNSKLHGFRIELVIAPTKALAIKWGQYEESLRFSKGKQHNDEGTKLAKDSKLTSSKNGLDSILACPVMAKQSGQATAHAACTPKQSCRAAKGVFDPHAARSPTEWRGIVDGIGRHTGGHIIAYRCGSTKDKKMSLCTNGTFDVDCRKPRLSIKCKPIDGEIDFNPWDKTHTSQLGPTVEVGSLIVDSTIGELMKAHRVFTRHITNHRIQAYNGTISNSSPLPIDDNMTAGPEPTHPESCSVTTKERDGHLGPDSHETMISGTKDGLKSRERRLTQLALHKRHGHLGYVPGCLICKMVRGSMRRVFSKVEPHVELRPGATWVCDMATWSHESMQGNQYCIVMRDIASGYFVALHAHRRDESLGLIRDWIVNARKNPIFGDLGFPIVQSLRLDKAGEWGINNKAWRAMMADLGVNPEYSSPDDKRSASHAENAIKQIEVVAKSILLENNLPYSFIELAVNQGVMLRNLYPLSRNVSSKDGDTIRPLEEISNGQISRRMCDNRIHHLIPLGTPCLVHCPKVKGTRVDKLKSRWGVSIGIADDLPEFFCPFDKSMSIRFHSKNYFECEMPDGWNYYTLLGLDAPPQPADARGNSIFPVDHEKDNVLRCFIDISQFVGQRNQRIVSPYTPGQRDGAHPNGILQPQVTLVDNHGTIYHQIDGDLKPTNDSVKDSFGNVGKNPLEKLLEGTDSQTRLKEQLIRAISNYPKSLKGKLLYKNYPTFGCYEGMIQSYNSKDEMWKIKWEDGTRDDMDADDLHKYLVHKVDDHLRDFSPSSDDELENEDSRMEVESAFSTPPRAKSRGKGKKMAAFDTHDSESPTSVVDTERIHKPLATRRKAHCIREMIDKDSRSKIKGPKTSLRPATGSRASKRLRGGVRVEPRPTDKTLDNPNSDSGIDDGSSSSDGNTDESDSEESEGGKVAKTLLPSYFRDSELVANLKWFTVLPNSRMTFFKLCDAIGVNPKYRRAYFDWLGPTFGPKGTAIHSTRTLVTGLKSTRGGNVGCKFSSPWGVGRKHFIREGGVFPIPSGKMWNTFKLKRDRADDDGNPQHRNSDHVGKAFRREIVKAYATTRIVREIVDDPLTIERYYAYLAKPGSKESLFPKYDDHKSRQEQIVRILANGKFEGEEGGIVDPRTGKLIPPKSFKTMLTRADREEWAKATLKELDSLDSLGVLDHDHTLEEIRKQGIKHSPVPMMLIYDAKYKPDGTFDKFKARDVVCGHKGFMRQGEHFTTTFSAAPSLVTTRLLQVLHVALKLKRKAWDIATAYLWAPCRENERIPIRYPVGLRRYDKKTGEELYAILKKNCYGMPQADRRYSQLRDSFILERFNKDGWSVKKARMDPCLFIFQSPKGKTTYVSIHTDDCEGVGDNSQDLDFIADEFHKRFKVKVGDPRFMLGIKREVSESKRNKNVTYMTMTQPDFVETTYATHKHLLTQGVPETPFPAGEFLHLTQSEPDPKIHDKYHKMGYMNIVGSLLWGARNCYPEMLYGVTQCCRLMSKPDAKAWSCACHMLQYMYSQKTRGIRFRSDGDGSPICYYDSSNKADPSDGKSQWGYCIYMFNGPIDWGCKKHNHVGVSSHHNEYMALSHATKAVVFIRQLLCEMGLGHLVKEATPVLGDNDCTTTLSREDMVTPGNKFFLIDYHFCKEQLELGQISTRRVDTKDNLSDLFTKAVSREDIRRLRDGLTGYGDLLPPPNPPPDD